jgi:flagellin
MSIMSLQTNLPSMNALRNLRHNQDGLQGALTRLSSGYRINWAGDDAAGLAISEKLKASIRSLSQAERNANDAQSVVHTAEGAMSEISNMLIRMRELAVQAANDTLGTTERGYLDTEFDELRSEIDRIVSTTEFNGQKLIDGSLSATGLDFQVGFRNTANDRLSMNVDNLAASGLGLTTAIGIDTKTGARGAMSALDTALSSLSTQRARLGAIGNRLQSTISNLDLARENLSAANSRIRDVDVAMETSALARSQVLVQAGVSMLAQANSAPGMMLTLLQ